MNRSITIIAGLLFAIAVTIAAVSSSATPVTASALAPVPAATPVKNIKKTPKQHTNLGGGDDLDGATPAARAQSTGANTNRSAAPSNRPGKAGKIPKAAPNANSDYTYGTLPSAVHKNTSGAPNRTTAPAKAAGKKPATNLSGGDDPDGVHSNKPASNARSTTTPPPATPTRKKPKP